MENNMNRAAARRAADSRQEIDSGIGTTPNPTPSDPCPVSLSAFDNAEVIRSTWMECLRDLRAHLAGVMNGSDIDSHVCPVLDGLFALLLIGRRIGKEAPCCPEANRNRAQIVKFHEALRGLVGPLTDAISIRGGSDGTAGLPGLIGSILERLPTEAALEGIAEDFRLPYCPCPSCLESYVCSGAVYRCPHCQSILLFLSRTPVPGQHS